MPAPSDDTGSGAKGGFGLNRGGGAGGGSMQETSVVAASAAKARVKGCFSMGVRRCFPPIYSILNERAIRCLDRIPSFRALETR